MDYYVDLYRIFSRMHHQELILLVVSNMYIYIYRYIC